LLLSVEICEKINEINNIRIRTSRVSRSPQKITHKKFIICVSIIYGIIVQALVPKS